MRSFYCTCNIEISDWDESKIRVMRDMLERTCEAHQPLLKQCISRWLLFLGVADCRVGGELELDGENQTVDPQRSLAGDC
jgi:hypothetical protein